MQRPSDFNAAINGHNVIAGPYTAAGGTTNFNFGYPSRQG
jgi:hypothetical protein